MVYSHNKILLSNKKPVSKGHIVDDCTFMIFLKRQICRDGEWISGCQGLWVEKGMTVNMQPKGGVFVHSDRTIFFLIMVAVV